MKSHRRAESTTPVPIAPLSPVSDLMTVGEAAKFLRVSQGWIYDHAGNNARKDPKIPCVRLGAAKRFRRSSLERYLSQIEEQAVKSA